jgi:hypothetical protein
MSPTYFITEGGIKYNSLCARFELKDSVYNNGGPFSQ